MDAFKFFHFGCWNLFACENSYPTSKIIQEINKGKYEFGLLAGDNIYKSRLIDPNYPNPQKTQYNTIKMNDGIKCINKLKIPVYVALGNHDIDDNNCDVIDLQIGIHKNWYMPRSYYYKIKYNSIFFIIDTNILEVVNVDAYPDRAVNNYRCYKYGTNGKHVLKKIHEDIDKMCDMFSVLDANTFDNIFIMGHNPIVTVKEKKDRRSGKVFCSINNLKYFAQLFDRIGQSQSGPIQIYYLCADTHNYQHISITYKNLNIEQIIAGTGGAKQDHINICRKEQNVIQELNVDLKKHCDSDLTSIVLHKLSNNGEFGFVSYDVNGTNVLHEFIVVGDDKNGTIYDTHPTNYQFGGNNLCITNKHNYIALKQIYI